MATTSDEIISIYRAEVQGYITKIEEIIGKVKQLDTTEKKQASDADINSRSLIASGQQRKKLLDDEIKNLKSLEAASKKAFTVPEIKDFNNRISESQRNIALLKGESGALSNLTGGLKSQFLGLGVGIAAAFSVGALVNFGKESVRAFQEAEKSAKLLESAIKNVAGGDDSAVAKFLSQAKELQKTTIFNDEQIQAAQTLAFQFGLTQEQVESLIPTIIDFASATGQDLQTALESVLRATEGQGRGLKVYGISIKDTADRSKDLANITQQLTEKFQGQGEVIGNTASGKIAKFNNQLDEIKEKVGGFITRNALAPIVDTISGLVNAIGGLGDTDLEILTNQFERQSEVTKNLTENISPLIDRYDELKSQSTLNVDEQKELESIILKVGDALPGSITGFDEYGKAIGISTSIAREAIQAQKDLTISLNQQKIGETQKEFDRLSLRLKTLVADLNSGTTSMEGFNNTLAGVGATATKVKLTPTDIAEFQKEAAELSTKVRGLGLELKSLKGEPLVIAPTIKDEINNLEKLKEKLKSLQDDLEKLPLTKFGVAIDPAEQARIVKAIADTQAQIDNITGKAAEEARKKAEERRKEALTAEKKLLEDINKLRIDLAPTDEEKVLIKAQIDRESHDKVKEDFRSLAEIEKQIDTDKNTFLRLNALKLVSDLKVIDEKRIQDIRAQFEAEIGLDTSRKKSLNQERVDEGNKELAIRKKLLQDQFASEDELQKVLLEHKIAGLKEGSVEQLQAQKELLELTEAQAEAAAKKEFNQKIINEQTLNDRLLTIRTSFGDKLNNIDTEILDAQQDKFLETFQGIESIASAFYSGLNELQQNNIEKQIEAQQQFSDSQQAALDNELSSLQNQLKNKLISQKTFDTQEQELRNRKLNAEKSNQAQLNILKKEQAEKEKLLKIFTIGLELAEAIAQLNFFKAAVDAIQLAFVVGSGIPAFKAGTKSKQGSGLAIVGEEGEEVVNLPSGAQVLPNRQTRHYRTVINSMFDNTFDDLIHEDYVIPAIIENEKIIVNREEIKKQQEVSRLKKSLNELIEDVVKKKTFTNEISEVENLNVSKQNKTEIINRINEISFIKDETHRTSAINSLKNYTNEIVSTDVSTKNIISNVIKKLSEKTISENTSSHLNISSQLEKLSLSKEEKQTLIKSFEEVYNSESVSHQNNAIKSLNTVSDRIIHSQEQTFLNIISEKRKTIQSAENIFIEKQNRFNEIISEQQMNLSKLHDYKFLNVERMVVPALQSQRVEYEKNKQESFAQNIAKAIVLNTKNEIKSDGIDEYGMLRVMEKNRRYDKAFAEFQAEKIAEEVSKILNSRRD